MATKLFVASLLVASGTIGAWLFFFPDIRVSNQPNSNTLVIKESPNTDIESIMPIKMLKDVGEPYLHNFGLTDADFKNIANKNFTIIEGNFDICADDSDVSFFLDSAHSYNLKVILPAGSGEAEWGYPCDENLKTHSLPIWESKKVNDWVKKWMNHPALFAWDTSNEAGGNFTQPTDETTANPTVFLTTDQLKTAYVAVKNADSKHLVMIRMNGWFFYDYDNNFFRDGNPFDRKMADIVMINAYSNVEDYYDDFVLTVLDRAQDSILTIAPKTQFIISLGVWSEPPLWYLPTPEHVKNDTLGTLNAKNLTAIAYFKYGAKESDWYLPRDNAMFWDNLESI